MDTMEVCETLIQQYKTRIALEDVRLQGFDKSLQTTSSHFLQPSINIISAWSIHNFDR
jgi:hypothetical protein